MEVIVGWCEAKPCALSKLVNLWCRKNRAVTPHGSSIHILELLESESQSFQVVCERYHVAITSVTDQPCVTWQGVVDAWETVCSLDANNLEVGINGVAPHRPGSHAQLGNSALDVPSRDTLPRFPQQGHC